MAMEYRNADMDAFMNMMNSKYLNTDILSEGRMRRKGG